MNCTNCGAPPTRDALHKGECSYCQTALPREVEAVKKAALARELLADHNQNGIPDLYEPALRAKAVRQPRSVNPTEQAWADRRPNAFDVPPKVWAIVGLAVIVIGVGVFVVNNGSAIKWAVKGPSKTPLVWNAAGSGSRLVDANEKAGRDVAGMARFQPNGAAVPAIVDGKTGKMIWRGAPEDTDGRLVCLSRRWFAIERGPRSLAIFDAKNPAKPATLVTKDMIAKVGVDANCLGWRTFDGTQGAIALPSGKAAKCKATPSLDLKGRALNRSLKSGTAEFSLEGLNPIEVVYRVDGKETWTRKLEIAGLEKGVSILLAFDRLYVVGERKSDRRAVLVALDPGTGKTIATVALTKSNPRWLFHLSDNGRHVLVGHGDALEAFKPSTLKRAWKHPR